MLNKLKENKWIIIAVVLVAIALYYFYQKNQTNS